MEENKNNEKLPPNRLKYQREKSRLTQQEVAKMLGVSLATVSRHENSSRGLTRKVIDQYAGLYKVTSAELFVDLPESEDGEETPELQQLLKF